MTAAPQSAVMAMHDLGTLTRSPREAEYHAGVQYN
jgi:hypothetical protein